MSKLTKVQQLGKTFAKTRKLTGKSQESESSLSHSDSYLSEKPENNNDLSDDSRLRMFRKRRNSLTSLFSKKQWEPIELLNNNEEIKNNNEAKSRKSNSIHAESPSNHNLYGIGESIQLKSNSIHAESPSNHNLYGIGESIQFQGKECCIFNSQSPKLKKQSNFNYKNNMNEEILKKNFIEEGEKTQFSGTLENFDKMKSYKYYFVEDNFNSVIKKCRKKRNISKNQMNSKHKNSNVFFQEKS